jgi:hypothetical protein
VPARPEKAAECSGVFPSSLAMLERERCMLG